ncbi:MAG: class I SAM-dependent methyltransferase, partial [Pseudomonadales bacterium]|nr:class I SAM-dependent methyltransferase [Pseudomonadales bacterium]
MPCLSSLRRSVAALTASAVLAFTAPGVLADHHDPLWDAITGPVRSADNVRRDVYRKPLETLTFFGLRADMTVLESWPGGGWYTEILAPYLAEEGQLLAATYDRNPETQSAYYARANAAYDAKLAENPDAYGAVKIAGLKDGTSTIAEAGSVDLILDFRNAHNWLRQGGTVPEAWFKALKAGGVVGIVDHSAQADAAYDPGNGYLHESQVIEVMVGAGFRFLGRSDHLANPLDKGQHPRGVWTLPPSLRLGEENQNHYLAIGESH